MFENNSVRMMGRNMEGVSFMNFPFKFIWGLPGLPYLSSRSPTSSLTVNHHSGPLCDQEECAAFVITSENGQSFFAC